jgi:hypothetical protein
LGALKIVGSVAVNSPFDDTGILVRKAVAGDSAAIEAVRLVDRATQARAIGARMKIRSS